MDGASYQSPSAGQQDNQDTLPYGTAHAHPDGVRTPVCTTVIHRPRSRPHIPAFRSFTETDQSREAGYPSLSSLKSWAPIPMTNDFTAGSISARNIPTEYELSATAHQPEEQTPSHGAVELISVAGASTPQPTIKTVELAASAKFFIESHFRAIANCEDRASQRIRRLVHLNESLSLMQTSSAERLDRFYFQLEHENQLLRQQRVQITQEALVASGKKNSFLHGFEVVRVLGKGSFGVVRLVQVRDDPVWQRGASESHVPHSWIGQQVRSSWRIAVPKGKDQKEVFAMKVIRKSEMIRNGQEGHIRAERDLLVRSINSRWVVSLISSFQDQDNLYLVMEYMIGGDFLGLLIRYEVIPEQAARFYLAEMVLAVQEIHNFGWIHRDIKPDNFLISGSGHLKISDFGLAFDGDWAHSQKHYRGYRNALMAKLGIRVKGDTEDMLRDLRARPFDGRNPKTKTSSSMLRDRTRCRSKEDMMPLILEGCPITQQDQRFTRRLAHSVVGTSQYMAPEIIRGDEYDGRCDWWSIGIILFESLYGRTPFLAENRQRTKERVLNHSCTLTFPTPVGENIRVSHEARNLIWSLLQEPEKRLTCRSYADIAAEKRRLVEMADLPDGQTGAAHATYDGEQCGLKPPLGHFVVENDGEDVQKHAFFWDTDWEHLHLYRPPKIPKVRDNADTKYFEQEPPVSDMSKSEDTEDLDEAKIAEQEEFERYVVEQYLQACETSSQPRMDKVHRDTSQVTQLQLLSTMFAESRKNKKHKIKLRPRDRALRDRETGSEVLEHRKRRAFMGYAYRRPFDELRGDDRDREPN